MPFKIVLRRLLTRRSLQSRYSWFQLTSNLRDHERACVREWCVPCVRGANHIVLSVGVHLFTRSRTHGTHSYSRTLMVTQIRSELKSTVCVLSMHTRDRAKTLRMPRPLREWSQKCAATLTFFAEFWCFGLAADRPKHIAVAMVSAKCCLSYGEYAKMCFRGVLKPQNVKNSWQPFCFHKIWWK